MSGLVIPSSIPVVEVPGPVGSPQLTQQFPAHAHCNDGDIVTLGVNTAGQIDPAVTNDNSALLLGVIQFDSSAVYAGGSATSESGVFGADNVGTGLLPGEPGNPIVAMFGAPGAITAINLRANCGWVSGGSQQANIGTAVGLFIDGNGNFTADPSASHPCATIVGKVEGATTTLNNGQTQQPVGPGGVGDLGARVYVQFTASKLAIAGGM